MTSSQTLEQYLAERESDYSSEHHMLGAPLHSPGYHTKLPDGIWAHATREALDYALKLLTSHDLAMQARAADVITAVLKLQDTDSTSRTYGIWPWYLEEPLDKMAPPDWNWADFCGARLADIIVGHGNKISTDLQGAIRAALGHAGWSIFRRNVDTNYTNISIMGAGVALAAGEILKEHRLIEYGRKRLWRQVEHVRHHGGFTEYNSPTYTIVVVEEAERIIRLVQDTDALKAAREIHNIAWKTIAEHFHPATSQWAGPHSRAYADWLSPATAEFLCARTGIAIPARDPRSAKAGPLYTPAANNLLKCPSEYIPLFRAWQGPERIVRNRFSRREPDSDSTYGTTWLCREACLGSVNADIYWTQRHTVLGYWATGDDSAVCLRLRFLHDGKDFASAIGRHAQSGSQVLSLSGIVLDRGDFHPSLDRPIDNVFRASDFRLRYELRGKGAAAHQIDEHLYELRAGRVRAMVHAGEGWFNGNPVVWELSSGEGFVSVDAICYKGAPADFQLASLKRTVVASAVELVRDGDAPTSDIPTLTIDDKQATATATWYANPTIEIAAPCLAHKSHV